MCVTCVGVRWAGGECVCGEEWECVCEGVRWVQVCV